ncbi:metallophosphoesterase [Lachnospiraceae bacterium 62-35]
MWKWIGGAAVCCGLAGLIRSEYEKCHFSIEHFQIASEKIKTEKKIVFLSDLHSQEFGKDNVELLSAIDRIRPDMIFIGGDMMVTRRGKEGEARQSDIEARKQIRVAVRLMLRLARNYPVYYGNGNHEQRLEWERERYGRQYQTYYETLKDGGVIWLSNQNIAIDEELAVGGFNIPKKYYQRFVSEGLTGREIEKRLGRADRNRYQILLAHSPLYMDAYREWGADLTLAGHFHGGTIRLPLLGGVMTPQYQFFYPRCAGNFEEKGKRMIVSRGLGTHSIRIRFNNKPQVAVVCLKKKV